MHLQGASRPATLLGLARRHGVALPVDDLVALRQWFRFRDFAHFVEVYALLRACLVEPADYELVTYELGAELAAQGVRYAEVTFTPGPEVYRGPRDTFFEGLTRGRERVQRDLGVELRWTSRLPHATVCWSHARRNASGTVNPLMEASSASSRSTNRSSAV